MNDSRTHLIPIALISVLQKKINEVHSLTPIIIDTNCSLDNFTHLIILFQMLLLNTTVNF